MDKLPSHDVAAEASLLAAALEDPIQVIPNARQRFGSRKVFYDVRHVTIWTAMQSMADAGRPIDLVTLSAWLNEQGVSQDAGGAVYLAELNTPKGSPANWPTWCDILIDHWAKRKLVTLTMEVQDTIDAGVPDLDALLTHSSVKLLEIVEGRRLSTDEPGRVKRPKAWAEDVWDMFFGQEAAAGEPGTELPFGFPWKIRPSELTLCVGDTGNGKTTFLCYLTMHMLARGWKGFVAFMEERPQNTIKMLMSQLMGHTRLDSNPKDHEMWKSAMEWYQQRVSVYDFLGIIDWHVLLQAMEIAAERQGCNFFVVDSLMRLGIADDDYAEQGRCVMAFANFANKYSAQVILVNHLNKSDRDTKARQRGSQQIVDNANNVIEVRRNEKKQQKICDIKDKCKTMNVAESHFEEELQALYRDWDAEVRLFKQRWQGSQQNGSKKLWFRRDALQYFDQPNPIGVDWMNRWKSHPLKHQAPGAP